MNSPPPLDPSDDALFARLADGDPMALRPLMDRYDRLVRFTIYRMSQTRARRDPLWLDSVASEVWTDLCRSLRTSPEKKIDHPAAYLIEISRRRCIDALRRRNETPSQGDPHEDHFAQTTANEEDTADMLEQSEELSALRDCTHALEGDDARLCSELPAITAGRWREAGAKLDMPESTLRSRWKKILAQLRSCLEGKMDR